MANDESKENSNYLVQKYGEPVKAAIWFGNPYIPWQDPTMVGGKLGQELVINASGECSVQSFVFNGSGRRAIASQAITKLSLPRGRAEKLLKRALSTLYFLGRVEEPDRTSPAQTTFWNTAGGSVTLGHYQDDDRSSLYLLSMDIRDALGRADLMVLDGNSHEDFIDCLEIQYSDMNGYREELTLSRTDDTISYRRGLPDGKSVTSCYHLPESVTEILNGLNPVDFTETIPGVPENAVKDEGILGHFQCTLYRRVLEPISFSGDYERFCLPAPWADLMSVLYDIMQVPATGALLQRDNYTRRRRCEGDYIYLTVSFTPDGKYYQYLTDDDTIQKGDYVIVPVGVADQLQRVQVLAKEYYQKDEVPYPLEKIKKIIGKDDK